MIKKFLRKANLVHVLCDHMLDKKHTHRHRMATGVGVMAIGVLIAKDGPILIPLEIAHFMCDGVGYLIHGIGAIPFAEYLMGAHKEDEQ